MFTRFFCLFNYIHPFLNPKYNAMPQPSSIHKTLKLHPALPFLLSLSLSMQPGFSQNYVYTYAGDGSPGYADGAASEARFNTPFGIALGPDGSLYLAKSMFGGHPLG